MLVPLLKTLLCCGEESTYFDNEAGAQDIQNDK